MINIHYMKKNYNWAKVTLVMGCMLGLGWLATPVMARDMDVRLMDEDTTIMVVAEVQPENHIFIRYLVQIFVQHFFTVYDRTYL